MESISFRAVEYPALYPCFVTAKELLYKLVMDAAAALNLSPISLSASATSGSRLALRFERSIVAKL